MSPASTMKRKLPGFTLDNECTTIKVSPGEPAPDFELLSHNDAPLRVNDSQPGDPARRTTVKGYDLLKSAEIETRFGSQDLFQLAVGIFDLPAEKLFVSRSESGRISPRSPSSLVLQ